MSKEVYLKLGIDLFALAPRGQIYFINYLIIPQFLLMLNAPSCLSFGHCGFRQGDCLGVEIYKKIFIFKLNTLV